MGMMFSLLASRQFWPLLVAQFGGAFNDNLFKQALMVLMVFSAGLRSGLDPKWLLTGGAALFIAPYVLFSALAGQLADKYEKSRLVRIIKWGELALMLLACAGLLAQQLWMLFVVLFALGAQSTFFSPLKYSLLPDYVPPSQLVRANAIIEATTFVAILAGNMGAALLIVRPNGALLVSAILLATSALGLRAAYRMPKAGPYVPNMPVQRNVLASGATLLREVLRMPKLGHYCLAIGWFWFVGSVFVSQFPLFGQQALGGDERAIALLLAAFSIGVAVGSFMAEKMLKGAAHIRFSPYCLGAMGLLTMVLYGLSLQIQPQLGVFEQWAGWGVFACLFFVAMAGGIYIVPLNTLLQQQAPEAMRARIIAANNMVNAWLMIGASVTVGGVYALGASVAEVFFCLGLGNLLLALYTGRNLTKPAQ